jgi:DNA-binding transcriptional regulator YiaG
MSTTTETGIVDYTFTPQRVKGIRIRLGLTQQAFADKVKVNVNMVCRWEAGATPTSGPNLKALLDAEAEAVGAGG